MKRNRAVFTMVYNESVFLPLWLRYYSRFFASEDIYVLDHESTDGSTSEQGFNRVHVPNAIVDCEAQLHTVQNKQHELINNYEMVLYSDVDEFVIPEPSVGNLGTYMDNFTRGFVNCHGYEILHLKDKELPLDTQKSIFSQRSYWFNNDRFFSKPLLTRIPIEWDLGCHSTTSGEIYKDSLYLVHLHRVDYDICLARHRQVNAREHSKKDLDNGWGVQRRIVEEADFETWFYSSSGASAYEPIPDIWKQTIL